MLRLTLAAAALALASAGDQFCFDHSGTPTGRAIITNNEDEDLDELGRPRLGKGPDASTTRLTLPG